MKNEKINWTLTKIPISHELETIPVPVVSDAIMATTGVGDGRMIPVVILDTSKRPDIDDMIRAHMITGNGDARSAWMKKGRRERSVIRLLIEVQQPSQCRMFIQFDIARQGGLVDQIVQKQGLYLQAGRPGDRFSNNLQVPRILLEVPSRHFLREWESMYRENMEKRFRQQGFKRRDARIKAGEFIQEFRQAFEPRMPDN